MKKALWLGLLTPLLVLFSTGCDSNELTESDLSAIVDRDGMAFSVESMHPAFLDRLAENKLVVVGERHFLREHHEFVAALVRELHGRGFRQLLLEWPHMANWLVADYINDGGLAPDWEPPRDLYFDLLQGVREFNRTLPPNERVRVVGVDVNLTDYGGSSSFRDIIRMLSNQLHSPGPLATFLQGSYSSHEEQHENVARLYHALEADRASLESAWGTEWYETVLEMAAVETMSVGIRSMYDLDYDRAAVMREKVMKQISDRRLSGYAHNSLLNVGSTHAQKKRLMGTDIEWLGDYLVHESAAVGGPVFVLAVTVARIVVGSNAPSYELGTSPENELWRKMNDRWPDHIVFLPFDDPIFKEESTPINFDDEIYRAAPKEHYDAFLLYPLAHRVI